MAANLSSVDLHSLENVILLNPRLPKEDHDLLYKLAVATQAELSLKGHVWIATSGSTASSAAGTKLVALSKSALLASANAVNEHLQATKQDVWTQVLPRFHVGGLGIELRASLMGSRVVNALKNDKWDVNYFYQTLLDERCTLSALVPTQVYDLVAQGLRAPNSLRAIVVGGGAFDVALYERARELGWPVLPSYGMTETASQIATAPLSSLQAFLFPGIQLLSHAEARSSKEGFLEIRAKSLFTCYAQKSDQGFKSWDPKIQGWFTSEDRGEVDGRILKIEGRGDDYVKIGGEGTNVTRLRGLLEQAAFALNPHWAQSVSLLDQPSARLGAEIHMITTLQPSEAEAVAFAYSQKALPFEKIRKIHFVDEIPRTDLGKIRWKEVRGKI